MEWTTRVTPAVAGIVVASVALVWAVQWGRVRRAQADARIKQDMLTRGLSVEEIEPLLRPPPGPAAEFFGSA